MALLTVQSTSLAGLVNPTLSAAAAGGDEFPNNGRTIVYIENADTVAHTVTIDSQAACSQGFDHDAPVSVPAGGNARIGPFLKDRFDDPTRRVIVSYDAVTSVSVAAISFA